MPKILCIPKKYINDLRAGVKSGDFDIVKMMEISSKKRRTMFEKYLPKDEAKFANTEFEKAITSNRKTALKDWAEKTFTGKDKSKKQSILDKINSLDEKGFMTPEGSQMFMEDMVSDKLGITLTETEANKIIKMTKELEKYADEKMKIGGQEINNHSLNYLKARQNLIKYMQSINPTSPLKIIASIFTRTAMLASFKSPLVNIVGNTTQGLATSLVRRLEDKRFRGLNPDLVKKFVKQNVKIYKESGYDFSRMFELEGDKVLGEKIVSTEGPGAIRVTGKILEDFVFKKMLGVPDVVFASAHFADTSNLLTTTIARREGLSGDKAKARAREIMFDSMALKPETVEGRDVRAKAIEESFYGTFTNDSKIAELTLGTRKLLNDATGSLSAGDQIIPFAKTPANVVAANLRFSGLALPWDVWNLGRGKIKGDKVLMKKSIQNLLRAGVGISTVFILISLIDPDDYVSEYADFYPKEKELIKLKGATYNSIKIGNTWVSLDYFGPFGSSFVGAMNARKYGDTLPNKIKRYYAGIIRQSTKIPGFNELRETIGSYSKATKNLVNGDYKKALEDAQVGFADFVSARSVPAIMSDIAAAVDEYERKSETALSKFTRRVPGLREKLPPKITLFGEEMKTQPGWTQLAFGSRVKTSEESPLVQELDNLASSGNLPSIASIEYSSTRVKLLKSYMGQEDFTLFMKDFGTKLADRWGRIIKKNSYKKLSPENKEKIFNKIKDKTLDITLGRHVKKVEDKIRADRKK